MYDAYMKVTVRCRLLLVFLCMCEDVRAQEGSCLRGGGILHAAVSLEQNQHFSFVKMHFVVPKMGGNNTNRERLTAHLCVSHTAW